MSHSAPPSLRSRRWRPLVGLVGVLFGLWTIWATLVLPRLTPAVDLEHAARSVAVRVLLWVAPAGWYLYRQHQRRALDGLRLNLPPSPSHWASAALLIAAAGFTVSLDVARQLDVSVTAVWWKLWDTASLEFPTTPLFEELIFRGVILSELLMLLGASHEARADDVALRGRAWLANLTASLVFVGLHWPWWIYTGGMDTAFWTNTAGVFLISLVLGMLFIRARSLWPCVLLHWLNNSLSSLTQ